MTKRGQRRKKNAERIDVNKQNAYNLIDEIREEALLEKAYIDVENDAQLQASIEAIKQRLGFGDINSEVDLKALLSVGSPSRTSEMQRNRQLIMEGTLPVEAYPDRFIGTEVKNPTNRLRGVDFEYQPDSEIRGYTVLPRNKYQSRVDNTLSTELIAELQNNEITKHMANQPMRLNTQTEYLSPEGINRLYEAWVAQTLVNNQTKSRNGRGYISKTDRRTFNDLLGEYYIQQGLHLGGQAAPVADSNRYNPALRGTDRLLEQSRGFSEDEMQGNLADLRYNDLVRGWQTGDPMVVGDAQMGDLDIQGLKNTVLMPSLIKKSNNAFYEPTFKADLQQAVIEEINARGNGGDTLDNAFVRMYQNNQLGSPTRSGRPYEGRFKDGKLMNNSVNTGNQNTDRQARMDRIIFGLSPKHKREDEQGNIPQELIQLNTNRTRNYIADELAKGNTSVISTRKRTGALLNDGSVVAPLRVQELINADAARPVIKDRALLEQYREPFAL